MIRTANSLDEEVIKILKLLLMELRSFYLSDYQSKLLSLLENIFQVSWNYSIRWKNFFSN